MNREVSYREEIDKVCGLLAKDYEEFILSISYVSPSGEVCKYFLGATCIDELKDLEIVKEYPSLIKLIGGMILNGKTSGVLVVNDNSFVVDVIRRERTVLVLGAGHVGRSLALISAMSGFNVVLVDDRENFLTSDKIVDKRVRCICADFQNSFSKYRVDSNSAVVIVTRGHQHDLICLREALKTDARYIGMIGSKRRTYSIISALRQMELSGHEREKLDRVYAPIGLEISAHLPEEIAVSILAQVIQVMNTIVE